METYASLKKEIIGKLTTFKDQYASSYDVAVSIERLLEDFEAEEDES